MRLISLMLPLLFALSACGADGPPEPPAAKPSQGVTVTGEARVGVVVEN